MKDQKMNMRFGTCSYCNESCNLNTHICSPKGITYQPKTLAGKIEMLSELELMKTQEPSMLIPLSLVMDLYAMATIADNKEVLEGLKKAIKGE